MRQVLIIERAILESLEKSSKSLYELVADLGIGDKVVTRVVSDFITRGLVVKNEQKYYLDFKAAKSLVGKSNGNQNVLGEVKDILGSVAEIYLDNRSSKSDLNVRKIHMDDFEEKIFNSLLKKVEEFVKGVEKKRDPKVVTASQKVVFWGHANYSSVIDQSLSYH